MSAGGFDPGERYPAIRPSPAQLLITLGGLLATASVLLPWVVSGTPEAGDASSFGVRAGIDFWRGLLVFVLAVTTTLVGLQLWQTPLTREVVEDRTATLVGLGTAVATIAIALWFLADVRGDFGGDVAGVFQGGPFGGASDGTLRNLARDFDPRVGAGWLACLIGSGTAAVGLLVALVRPATRAPVGPW